jgi:hypothetical protein
MTRHQHPVVRSVVRRLWPSLTSFAAAAALYDPGLLLQLQATQRERAVNSPKRRGRHGPRIERYSSSLTIAPPSPA